MKQTLTKFFYSDQLNVDKYNLFATSTDHIIDFDRKMVSNYVRFIKRLDKKRLSDLKNYIVSIAHKKGVCVSFVNSEYTSQTCSACGHIDKNNRKTQEVFCCTRCNYLSNADKNAAHVIKSRASQDVLVKKLLSVNKSGEYSCKKLSHERIKSVLLNYAHDSSFNEEIAILQ